MIQTRPTRLAFAAKQLLRPAAALAYRDCLSRQDLSSAASRAYSLRKMRDIVEHAAGESPFYSEYYASGTADLESLPLLTRETLVSRFHDIRVRNVPKRHEQLASTSGTTGTPARVLLDKRCHSEVVMWRVLKSWGVHPGDDIGVLKRSPRSKAGALANDIIWFPTRRIFLDNATVTEETLHRFTSRLIETPAKIILGWAGAMLEFANFLDRNMLRIPAPRAIWVTASPLTDEQRKFIGAVLGAPVFDQYGSVEVNSIAAECDRHSGLHVQIDRVVVEVLDDSGIPVPPGTWGHIVVTDLMNYLFPLVRYETGDVGRFIGGDCPCGSGWPRLDHIRGRMMDTFRFRDGTMILCGPSTIFEGAGYAVRRFRVHQVSLDEINVYCVPRDHDDDTLSVIQQAFDKFSSWIGNRSAVTLFLVETISSDGAKPQFVVSDVKPFGLPKP